MEKKIEAAFVIDTREPEHTAYRFEGYPTIRAKLDAGDYSLRGYEDKCCVERKTKEDAYGVVGAGRARFERCLGRLQDLDRAAVVIEADLHDFAVPPPRTRIDAAMAVGSYVSWACIYRIPIFWCGSREYAEAVTRRFLIAYVKHLAAPHA